MKLDYFSCKREPKSVSLAFTYRIIVRSVKLFKNIFLILDFNTYTFITNRYLYGVVGFLDS